MFCVYVLYAISYDRIYIGYTSNLESRLMSHNFLANKGYTSKFRPWIVVYTEYFETKKEAIIREKQLKSAKGRLFVRQLIEDFSKRNPG
ncbi:GIY-YIG nuclease family protein [Pedobacter sp. SYP-B3415]|uniref:GIY-YIG nuclease family protein n=1 Tax=Pedobacter sp. SYP-B3415 TaxID=2496641 RepID=UPI00101C9814|nr:GIY-YIG nuclease family protein [Pedobacter sp. SYP-B3415]